MKYHIEKSIQINAPLDKVYSQIADFDNWKSWSPWTIVEPDCSVVVTGEAGQPGYKMVWEGEIIGIGSQALVEVSGNVFNYELEFLKPMRSKAKASFRLEEKDGGVNVTWSLDSGLPFFFFFMVKIIKNWIGMDYERGLRMLKEVSEKGEVNASTVNAGISEVEGFSYVGIKRTIPFADLSKDSMKNDFRKLIDEVVKNRGKSAKHWVSLYPKMNMRTMMITYIAAVSAEELKGIDLGEDFVRGEVATGRALEIKHHGSYEFLGNAWSMGMMYLRAKKIKQKGVPMEYYRNSPHEVDPEDLKTSVYFPVKS